MRERGYWLRQADAIKRQWIAVIAHGVGIGMAIQEDREKAVDELELSMTAEESRNQKSAAAWDLMRVLKGGHGV